MSTCSHADPPAPIALWLAQEKTHETSQRVETENVSAQARGWEAVSTGDPARGMDVRFVTAYHDAASNQMCLI